MEQLMARIEALEGEVRELSAQKAAAERRAQQYRGMIGVAAVCCLILWPLVAGGANGDRRGGPLPARVAALEDLLSNFSRRGNDVYVTGANLHVRNGMKATGSLNGLGNLIVGYNEPRAEDDLSRLGSHNLVLGSRQNYSSYGGVVAGAFNEISAPYASVLGGAGNVAAAPNAAILGGRGNVAAPDQPAR